MRTVRPLARVAIPVVLATPLASQARTLDKRAGVEIALPGEDWKQKDLSASGVVVRLYSPSKTMVPRVTLMRFPKVFLKEGMKTRAKQIEAAAPDAKRVRFEKDELGGREATAFVYDSRGVRTEERSVELEDAWVIVQIAAAVSDWEDKADTYASVWESVKLLKESSKPKVLRVRTRTPAQIRADRARMQPGPRSFGVASHDIRLDLDPGQNDLSVRDDLVVEGLDDTLEKLDLLCSHVKVDGFTSEGRTLAWKRTSPQTIEVALAEPLRKGGQVKLRFTAHSEDYRFAVDQKLVAEVAVLGQVTAESSFSSHVYYYPVDRPNDAAVTFAISVPKGYVAVTGGDALGSELAGDRRVFRYGTRQRTPRGLPFGFAAGRFARLSDRTPGGIELELYFPQGKEKEARQRLDVAVESGALLERWMGPLPWKRVAFCNVRPFRKETGVSLPGLILISDRFFRDVTGVEIHGDAMDDLNVMGLMVVADELSHQWNFYSVPLPNELAEGVSTFTNLLWVGKRAGPGEYRKGIDYCANAYLATAAANEDVAVADPAIYRSPMYRAVAFCKVPAALDLLRQRLGEETFRKAWHQAFVELRGQKGSFDRFAHAFGEAAGVDVAPFFEQWMFQPGYPRLSAVWANARVAGKDVVKLEVEQTQPAALFDVALEVTPARGDAGEPETQLVRVSQRKQKFLLKLAGPVKGLYVEPARRSPLIQVKVRRAK